MKSASSPNLNFFTSRNSMYWAVNIESRKEQVKYLGRLKMMSPAVKGNQIVHLFSSIRSQDQEPQGSLLAITDVSEVKTCFQEPEVMENGAGFPAPGFTTHSLWTALHAVSMELLLLWGQ